MNAQLAAAAVWTAARYGLRGSAVDLRTGRTVDAVHLLDALVTEISPALEELGDLITVRATVATVRANGTGADHQRCAASGGPLGVVRMLARRTLETPVLIGER